MKHYELYKDEELVSMYRDGDARAVDEIMERYKNLVRKKANAMYIVGGDKDDLIQEGMIGLYKAVTTYDELKAASFATFASLCINGQLMNAVKASNAKKNTPLNSYVSFDTPANKSDDESLPVKSKKQESRETFPRTPSTMQQKMSSVISRQELKRSKKS